MAFTPTNEIETLLAAAASNVAARSDLYRGLMQHQLFAATTGRGPEAEQRRVATEDTEVQLRTVQSQGKFYVAVFTSADRVLSVYPQGTRIIRMQGDSMLETLRGKDFVLNPGLDLNKVFTPTETAAILDGTIFKPDQAIQHSAGKKIMLGRPKDYPRHITGALEKSFARSRDVKAAYLAHAFIPETDTAPRNIIGLEVDGDWQRVMEEVSVIVREIAKPSEFIDFVRVQPNANDTVGKYMREETKPFYVRRKWLGLF